MVFSKMIPELTVFDIEKTREFYVNLLGFKLEYERPKDLFVFLSFEGSQFMFEQLHESGWNVGELTYPLGQGINFSIETTDIDDLYHKLQEHSIVFFRTMMVSSYEADGELIEQKEFLIQDPDGYLLRFTN